jgi:hypothetical protein
MRWRDIRFEKPTEADGDQYGEVLFFDNDGDICASSWSNDTDGHLFWMAMSEIPKPPDRIPDPPEGWRFVEKEKDKKRLPYKYVSKRSNEWEDGDSPGIPWERDMVYAVPIDPPKPPEPQYRPYNAAELKQTIGKLVDGISGYRAMITGACGDSVYCQGQRVPADQLLKKHTWTDGGRCGVKVEP